jgi:chromosome segregation ATPase
MNKGFFKEMEHYRNEAATLCDKIAELRSMYLKLVESYEQKDEQLAALAAENERLRKDYESILNDRNLLWRDYKDSQEAYQRLHHSFMCLRDAAKEGGAK